MADRFPSLEEFDSGGMLSSLNHYYYHQGTHADLQTAQTESKEDSGFEPASGDDFLSREKALLGEDADQFATGNDSTAFVDAGDDLLGGGGDNEEVTEFESSFPAIDTQNEVSPLPPPSISLYL